MRDNHMRLQKYTKKAAATASEDQLFLRLQNTKHPNGDGVDVVLVLIDKEGKRVNDGALMYFDNDLQGVILLNEVSSKYPLKTDISDTVAVIKENEVRYLSEVAKIKANNHHRCGHQQETEISATKIPLTSELGKQLLSIVEAAKKADKE